MFIRNPGAISSCLVLLVSLVSNVAAFGKESHFEIGANVSLGLVVCGHIDQNALFATPPPWAPGGQTPDWMDVLFKLLFKWILIPLLVLLFLGGPGLIVEACLQQTNVPKHRVEMITGIATTTWILFVVIFCIFGSVDVGSAFNAWWNW